MPLCSAEAACSEPLKLAWRALLEAGVRPDLVCGTSVGAINGAAIAADPTPEGAQQLLEMWDALGGTTCSAVRWSAGSPAL
jgi:predicted acylesterase/phospholipase RssA